MSLLGRFRALPPGDRRLAIKAAILVVGVRIGLWVLSYRWLANFLHGWVMVLSPPRGAIQSRSAERIVWAVSAVSRCVPQATCLTQALTAETLLRACGYPASINIGVAKHQDGIEAHAWVELDGTVLIGHRGIEKFTRLRQLAIRPGLHP